MKHTTMDPNAKELSSTVKMATYKQEAHRGFNCLYEKKYGDALELFTKVCSFDDLRADKITCSHFACCDYLTFCLPRKQPLSVTTPNRLTYKQALEGLEKLRHVPDQLLVFYEYKILGGRVHALEKLGEHKEAIRDSYRMMMLMPKKATVYTMKQMYIVAVTNT